MRYTGSSNRLRRKLDLLSDSQSLESRGRLGGRPGDAKRRPQTRVQIDVDVARCPISRRRPPPVPPQCGPGFRERGRAPPHVCQSLKDHRGRAVRQTLARGRRPSQTRDAAAGDLARDPLPSCRHSQSKEHEQRGRRTTRGRCQDAHGSRGSGCRTKDPISRPKRACCAIARRSCQHKNTARRETRIRHHRRRHRWLDLRRQKTRRQMTR